MIITNISLAYNKKNVNAKAANIYTKSIRGIVIKNNKKSGQCP